MYIYIYTYVYSAQPPVFVVSCPKALYSRVKGRPTKKGGCGHATYLIVEL